MKTLRAAFITGILILVPLVATIDILIWFVRTVDDSIRRFFPLFYLPFDFKGLGTILALLLILATGLLAQNYIGNWIIRLFDSWLKKVALVGGLYGGIKKFLETIFNPTSDQFNGAVLVPFPRAGVYSIGFRTGHPDAKLLHQIGDKYVNVFVPCTPNPTSGFYLLVPEGELIALDMTVQEAFKTIISMGLVHSDEPVVDPQKGIRP